jgi:hypothetical protein
VALAGNLHPEFGFVGSPSRLRRLGVAFSFAVFGLVAGAGGVQVFMLPSDSAADPMRAMALAPAPGLRDATPPAARTSRDIKSTQAPPGHAVAKLAVDNSPCRERSAEPLGNDCAPVRVVRPRAAYAMNERPAIAAVPIGHRHDPAMLPRKPAAPVFAPEDAGTAIPAEAAPAANPALPAPPPAATPARRGSAVASGYNDAKAIERSEAKAAAASVHPRRATRAIAMPVKPEDTRGSGDPPAHRRSRHGPGHGSTGVDALAHDVIFNNRQTAHRFHEGPRYPYTTKTARSRPRGAGIEARLSRFVYQRTESPGTSA